MLNPLDANAELSARVVDLLLRIKFSGLLTQDEIKDLCYAAGISTHHLGDETAAQKLFRQRRELREVHLRG